MKKLPPIEKIYEAYSAIADNRIDIKTGIAFVKSSDGTKSYQVEWQDNIYSSTDSATYWQGYAGYPIISILILQNKLHAEKNIITLFSDVKWNELNKKHKRNYRKALLEVFEAKHLTAEQIEIIETKTKNLFEQLKNLEIEVARKINR